MQTFDPRADRWRIRLFGVLQLMQGERTVTRFRTQNTGALLAYLAYFGGRPQPREVLIDLFWPDADLKAGRGRLSIALSSLRAQLTPRTAQGSAELILADSATVGLNPSLFETDVTAFTTALTRAERATGSAERTAFFEEAVGHYGGDLLPGYYEDWIVPEQERLRERFLRATTEVIRAHLRSGEPRRAVLLAQRAVDTDPLRGEAWCDLLRILTASGDAAEALRYSREAEERFAREGISLPPTVAQLTRQIAESAPVRVTAPADLPSSVPPPCLSPGTYTALLAEGEADELTALCEAARQSGGIDVSPQDTAAWFVFADTGAAVTAVVAGIGPRIRAALDTGMLATTEAIREQAPLRGLPRLIGGAHPGQIVCSEATAVLLRHTSLPVRLRDLGVYRRTADDPPERLFQAESSDQPPSEFPPLRLATGYTSQLPQSFTRFFGRADEVTRIETALSASSRDHFPFLTLTGPGGVGKTRLSLEVAARLEKSYAGRVWFVPLADVQTSTRIPSAIREALRLPVEGARDPLEQAATFLSEAPSLLVLDNLEHLTAQGRAADALSALRERVSTLAFLVTSRQMIGVAGERAIPVGPLLPPLLSPADDWMAFHENACVQLFIDRARAARPDFALTATNAAALARLCAVLEGIPLALELAAARAGLLSPAQILVQVESRFALLHSRRRDLPERHRSLWAAVDSSYQILSPDLQRLFARLSLFRGGWTLDAVHALAPNPIGSPTDTLDALSELQECSLLLSADDDTATPRFRMLETLREFGAERFAESGEVGPIGERYQAYFTDLALAAAPHLSGGGDDRQEWLDRLESDHDNLRATLERVPTEQALRISIALHRFWLIRGHIVEGRLYLERFLAAATTAPEADRARAQNAAGILAWSAGALEAAEQHFTASLAGYQAVAGPAEIAQVLNNLGIVTGQRGNFTAARHSFEESLSLYRTLGDTLRQSMVLTNLGGVLVYLQEYAAARVAMENCVPIQRAAGDDFSLLRTLQNLAEIACRQGDIPAAAVALRESLGLRRTLGDQSMFWDALVTAAAIANAWERQEDATLLFGAAEAAREAAGATQAPADREYNHQLLRQIQAGLTAEERAVLEARGRAIDFEGAVEIAERALTPESADSTNQF